MSPLRRPGRRGHWGLALFLSLLGAILPGPLLAGDESSPGTGAPPAQPPLSLTLQGPSDAAPLPLKTSAAADRLQEAKSRGYLTLQDCYAIAVQENERIGRAKEDATQASLVKLQARGAVLPLVTLEDNYYRQNPVSIAPTGGTATAFSFADTRNQLTLHLKQPIFHGLRELSFFKYAGANIEAFDFALENSRRLLYIDVAQIFYLVLQLEGQVKALEDTVEVENQRLKEVQARHEAGLARKTEVLLVQSQLAQDESQLTSTRNDLQVARQRLTFLMTIPVDLPLKDEPARQMAAAAASGTGDGGGELAELVRVARSSRNDLRQLEAAVRAAEAQVDVARGARLPSIDLDAYGYLDRSNYSSFQQLTDWSAEVDFSFPVFDGGQIKAAILTAKSQLQQAILSRDQLARQVELEVQAAYLTLQSDEAQLRTLEVSVDSADENDRLVREEYRSGLATNLEVYAAQNQLLTVRLDLERQKYQVGLDFVALELAQGLLPADTGTVPGPPQTAPAEGPAAPPAPGSPGK